MEKDFAGWSTRKEQIHTSESVPFYKEREIWWCALGVNVGFEQDGTGSNYDRPVLIIRGFNPYVFFGVALTGRMKTGKYYFPIGRVADREASVVLSQARIIDTKRLVRKISTLDESLFKKVCAAVRKVLFG